MADPIYLVQGDTGPQIRVVLTRQDTGLAEDITDATVRLYFRKKFTETVLFTLTGQSTPDEEALGTAVFVFSNGQLDLTPGEYEGEVEVVFDTGTRETVYEVIDFVLRKDFA
jgi:hypothetical protein